MTELILGSLFLCSLGMWGWREYQHDQERRDLLDRLMARDYSEYKDAASSRPPPRAGNVITAYLERQKAGDE